MGHTAVFGAALVKSTTGQAQNIFDFVSISTWTSRPMTGSYLLLMAWFQSAGVRPAPNQFKKLKMTGWSFF
jgi:hypothetical protein